MLMTNPRSRPATPVRARSPHSMMIAASKSPAASGAISISGTPGNSIRGGGAGSRLTTRTCLPRARRAYAMASCEPIASPSGRACEDSTNVRRARIASTMRSISGAGVVTVVRIRIGIVSGMGSRANLVQELFDAILARNRLVVHPLQFGRALEPQPRSDLTAEERNHTVQRARARLARLVVAEDRVEHAGLLQVGADLHARDRHEADAGVVNFPGEQEPELAAQL